MSDIKPELKDRKESPAPEVRVLQNELVPIARLPPEILADIFVRCTPATPRELHEDFSWLNLTRVSANWRNIALATPAFWGTLILSRPKWTPVMLARSKMTALIVRVDLEKDLENSPEPILLEHAARLATLDVHSPQHLLATFLSNLQHADAAPRLQCVKVVNATNDNLGEGGMWLPPDLFRRKQVMQSRKAGVQQELRLHLERCAFPWESGSWYSHLTHLHLENIHPAQRPGMKAFLSILVGSPALQMLSVLHASPTFGDGFTVDLPLLSALSLKDESLSTCTRLFGLLVIPPSATVKISSIRPSPDTEFDTYKTLIPMFSAASPDTYDTVRLSQRLEQGLAYYLSNSARPDWFRKLGIGASEWPGNNMFRLTETILSHLDFSNVTTLHLRGMDGGVLSRSEHALLWDTMGHRLVSLRVLHLHNAFPSMLFEFLLTQALLPLGISHYASCFKLPGGPSPRAPDGELSYAFPGLQRLALHGLDLEAPAAYNNPTRADALRALLWARRAGRAAIWQLEITDCSSVDTRDLGYFGLFADVVWDGKGGKTAVRVDVDESLEAFSINVFANLVDYIGMRYGSK
ncbi:hypothetical protein C8R43DRAFT_917591 [Mycena crocata]|nr:hypothetical protein C8R43DRAFT_917591 [Mycena crocata]